MEGLHGSDVMDPGTVTGQHGPRRAPLRRWRKPLLIAHVSAAVGLVGADLALLTLAVAGAGDADPSEVYPAMSLVADWVLAPLAVAALVTGIAQLLVGRFGLRDTWVTIKLALTAVLTALVLLVVSPGIGRMADAARGEGSSSALDNAVRYVVVPSVSLTLLVFMATLGIYKPPWRLRGSGRP